MLEFQITDPFSGAARELDSLEHALLDELRTASLRMAAIVSSESKKLLDREVYSIPIPLTAGANRKLGKDSPVRGFSRKGQHGQWRRRGELRQGETFAFTLSSQGVEVVFLNVADHAAARAALGGPNPPNKAGRKAGEQRSQTNRAPELRSQTRAIGDWHARVVVEQSTLIEREYQAALDRALTRFRGN